MLKKKINTYLISTLLESKLHIGKKKKKMEQIFTRLPVWSKA